jgi:hypothetical protein
VQLGHGLVALVDDEQEVVGEVVEQVNGGSPDVGRRCASSSSRCRCSSRPPDHLEVVLRAHAEALGLEQLPVGLEPGQPLLQLGLDCRRRPAFIRSSPAT